jgi:hypothetical protein
MARASQGLDRKKQKRRMLSAKVKNRPFPSHRIYRPQGLLSGAYAPRINCRWNIPSLTNGPHHDRGSHTTARTPPSRRGNRRVVSGGHVRLPTPPTTHAAAAPEKACPWRETTVATASIKWPCPLLSKEDPRAARAPSSNKYDPRRVQTSTIGLEARLK